MMSKSFPSIYLLGFYFALKAGENLKRENHLLSLK